MNNTFEGDFVDNVETPLGPMEVTATEHVVTSIYFVDQTSQTRANAMTALAVSQLREYFEGRRTNFDIPMAPRGTAFQKQVWAALLTVGHGETCSYSEIARLINNPKAVRAVGAANGKNPMTIVVPCHRVIGADGSLTGYASGTTRKKWLLNHESDSLF